MKFVQINKKMASAIGAIFSGKVYTAVMMDSGS